MLYHIFVALACVSYVGLFVVLCWDCIEGYNDGRFQ